MIEACSEILEKSKTNSHFWLAGNFLFKLLLNTHLIHLEPVGDLAHGLSISICSFWDLNVHLCSAIMLPTQIGNETCQGMRELIIH